MPRPADMLREFVSLERRRVDAGVTPLEYQRWLDLCAQLERQFPGKTPPRTSAVTRMVIELRDRRHLRESKMGNVRPIGIFVNTPFAPELGTQLDLRLILKESGEEFGSLVEVVSNNVGDGFSTANLGMGLRFRDRACSLCKLLEELCR